LPDTNTGGWCSGPATAAAAAAIATATTATATVNDTAVGALAAPATLVFAHCVPCVWGFII